MKAVVALFLLTLVYTSSSAQLPAGMNPLEKGKAKKMIKKYDGWFRNQRKTNALEVDADKLKTIIEGFPGKKVQVVLARYLGEDGIINEKRRRVTFLLFVPKDIIKPDDGTKAVDGDYYDLAVAGVLCPPPYGCSRL
jgi:hypothetical protein